VSYEQWACFLRRSPNDHLGNLITVIQGGKVPAAAERLPTKYLVKEEAPKIISSPEQHPAYLSRLLELQRKAHRHLKSCLPISGRVATKVLINASGRTGIYYDDGGRPMLGSTLVRDPRFTDRVVAETRALLATTPTGACARQN
jgi:hypothetical protein